MKCARFIVITMISATLFFNVGSTSFAFGSEFITDNLTIEEETTFIKNIKLTQLINEPPKGPIKCFDVSKNGVVAIGTANMNKKTIMIYDSNNNFKKGYEFYCDGNFGIEWDNNNLLVYFVRGDIAASINEMGKFDKLLKIRNTIDNNSYWNNEVFATVRSYNGCEYVIKNDMGILNIFASSYSQLVRIDNKGDEEILYDVNSEQINKYLLSLIGITVFVLIIFIITIFWFIKMQKCVK